MSECKCRVCTDHRRWLAALNPQSEQARKAFEEMCTNLEAYSTDAVYWRMKFEGTWDKPDAVTKAALYEDRESQYLPGSPEPQPEK